jgi:acyl carrier protein
MDKFIEKFADAIEIDDASVLSADTEFKLLAEWSSLSALSIIAMVDEEYDVELKGQDIRSCETLADLFEIVKSKA